MLACSKEVKVPQTPQIPTQSFEFAPNFAPNANITVDSKHFHTPKINPPPPPPLLLAEIENPKIQKSTRVAPVRHRSAKKIPKFPVFPVDNLPFFN